MGFIWDSETYSCAYDALFTILFSVYTESTRMWNASTKHQNRLLAVVTRAFKLVQKDRLTMEEARHMIRHALHLTSPSLFPVKGRDGTDIFELCHYMFDINDPHLIIYNMCDHCRLVNNAKENGTLVWNCSYEKWNNSTYKMGSYKNRPTSAWIQALFSQKSTRRCPTCMQYMVQKVEFTQLPDFVLFNVRECQIKMEHTITLQTGNESYRLCGVIYFGSFHFTARIVTSDGLVWFNDGIQTKSSSQRNGNIGDLSSQVMSKAKGRKASIMIYTRL